jgi:hypothetical protein
VADFELRWIDTSSVTYDWQGVVGNTGPAVGQRVLRSEDWQQDLAIAGEVGVRAWGYNEAYPGCSMFETVTPSSAMSIAHSDYHRVFALAATDGEVGYFVNTGGATDPRSFFHTAATFVIGVDLKSNCEHNFTTAGHPQCTLGTGQIAGGTMGKWSFCKPAGSECAYPGSDCANGGATKDNYNGCNGKAEYAVPSSCVQRAWLWSHCVTCWCATECPHLSLNRSTHNRCCRVVRSRQTDFCFHFAACAA